MASVKLAAVAPLVIPLDLECTGVEGFISAAGAHQQQHWVRLTGITPDSLLHAHLELDQAASDLLSPHMDLIHLRLAESPDIPSFLVELRNLLAQASSTTSTTSTTSTATPPLSAFRSPAFYTTLKEDFDAIGWDCINTLAPDLSSFTLNCTDCANRTHTLALTLPPPFPAAPPRTVADLPTAFTPRWGAASRLLDVMHQFQAAVAAYQKMWDDFEELDSNAWVIEPSAPTRSCTFRRLALEKHVTLAVTLDPVDLEAVPELQFMGSDRAVEPLLSTVRERRRLWQPHCSLKENLEMFLGAALPSRQAEGSTAADDVGADCSICYNYRRPMDDVGDDKNDDDDVDMIAERKKDGGEAAAEGDVPDINCDNAACGKPFHRLCLREWLAADASTRQSFGSMFGACPYCSAPIAVKAM